MQLYYQAFSTLIPKAHERPILSPDPFSGMSLGLSNCRPTSVGEIMIKSADPFEAPRITPNAYSTDHDVQEMLEAVKFIRKIAAQKPLADLIVEELRPGPSVQSDEDLIADFRKRSGTVYHPSCTARMAPSIKDGVVDGEITRAWRRGTSRHRRIGVSVHSLRQSQRRRHDDRLARRGFHPAGREVISQTGAQNSSSPAKAESCVLTQFEISSSARSSFLLHRWQELIAPVVSDRKDDSRTVT